jgi:hypothetical protein
VNLCPITIKQANAFVRSFHRHNEPTHGGRWAIGVESEVGQSKDLVLVGVAIVGNPLSATFMDGFTAEVLRVCTMPDAPKNACSMLYSACWRAWRAMGGRRIVTYTLQSETGISLKASNWQVVAECRGKSRNWGKGDKRRDWQPIFGQAKFRWEPIE